MIESKKGKIIKLIDFGASAILSLDKNRKLKEVVGSPYYIAPEVLLGSYDERCDIWSIGVILFTMLAGRPPFEGYNELEIIQRIKLGKINYDIPELEDVPEPALDLIKRLLQYDPNKRISLDQALKHPFIMKYDDFKQDSQSVLKCLLALQRFNTS